MPLTLSGNGTISDLASAPTVGGTALPTNSDLPTLSTLGIPNHDDISVDSSGRMTNSSQVCLSATDVSPLNVLVNEHTDISYTRVEVNIGNHYNTSTGVFTCPIAGRYLVAHSHLTYSTGNAFTLNKNGSAIARSYLATGSSVWNQVSIIHTANCQANDTLNMSANGVYLHSGHYGQLNIILIL